MGLDLVVEGCAKPGHESEWRVLIERSFSGSDVSEAEIARFREINIPGYQRVGAPRVGSDAAADEWIINAQRAQTPEEKAAALQKYSGYYVLRLLESDGIPKYSNGGLYQGVDETSFRGEFLRDCENVIDKRMLDTAWGHKLPEAAIEYGRALLAAADAAEKSPRDAPRGLLARLGVAKSREPAPLSEQLDIARAAGRWFIFWGELGHPIRAYY